MPDPDLPVSFDVLGPLRIHIADQPAMLPGPGPRMLLGSLLLTPTEVMRTDQLLRLIWGPEQGNVAALHTTVSRLRAWLRDRLPGIAAIDRGDDGYRLRVDPHRVDVARFRALLADVPGAGLERRIETLDTALRLWRGPVLGQAVEWLYEDQTIIALEHDHTTAVRDLTELCLRANRPEVVVPHLRLAIETHPYDEPLHALLIRALAAGGWLAEATRVYDQLDTRLGDELGVVPSVALRDLHHQVLTADPCLTTQPTVAPTPAAPIAPIPRQLPSPSPLFVGRLGELTALTALVNLAAASRTVVISAIGGAGGIGKSWLALRWAHNNLARFPDGQLYLNLRGFDPSEQPLPPATAVRGMLSSLGIAQFALPADPDAQVGLYRSLVADKRMLILLDNARDADQVRPLLPGTAECVVLVTSRNQLSGLIAADGAEPLTLGLLSAAEARELLTRRLGPGRTAAEPDAVEDIIRACAGLPLALAIVAARAVRHPGFALRALAAELSASQDGLDGFASGDPVTDVRGVFSWSYRAVSAPAARLFRLLGLHPGPDIGAPAAASLAGLPAPRTRMLLTELTQAHLITETTPGRYTLHDLLRAYATELANTDADDERRAALRRMFDHYLHTAFAGERVLWPPYGVMALDPLADGVTPQELSSYEPAMTWFTAEHAVLLAVIEQAATTGFNTHAWQLAACVVGFLDLRGHWHDWIVSQQIALEAAQRLGDRLAEAHAHRFLGGAEIKRARYPEAGEHYRRALVRFGEFDDLVNQAFTHRGLGWLADKAGDHREALDHDLQALALFRRAGHRAGEANTLNSIGWCHAQLGNYAEATAQCEQALRLLTELGDHGGTATTYDSLAYIYLRLDDHERARVLYQRSYALFQELGDRHGEAEALARLADIDEAGGDLDAARAGWQRALVIFEELQHPDAEQLRGRLDGHLVADDEP